MASTHRIGSDVRHCDAHGSVPDIRMTTRPCTIAGKNKHTGLMSIPCPLRAALVQIENKALDYNIYNLLRIAALDHLHAAMPSYSGPLLASGAALNPIPTTLPDELGQCLSALNPSFINFITSNARDETLLTSSRKPSWDSLEPLTVCSDASYVCDGTPSTIVDSNPDDTSEPGECASDQRMLYQPCSKYEWMAENPLSDARELAVLGGSSARFPIYVWRLTV
jgi:hypothetical protein